MPNFDPHPILADFAEYRQIFSQFMQTVPDAAWSLKTGERDKDWTMHETLAHLVSVAQLFNLAAEHALTDKAIDVQDFTQRGFLATWNQREIAELSQQPPPELASRLMAELEATEAIIPTLTVENLGKLGDLPVYNRPARVIDFVDWQLSHAGIVHAAQITRPIEHPPLWESYSAEMMRRQVDRFVRHFSYAYWPELGPDEPQAINFHIQGAGGGDWHLTTDENGGGFGQGLVENATYHAQFATPPTFFGLFTFHVPFREALSDGRVVFMGDMRATMQLLRLFSATPPKL